MTGIGKQLVLKMYSDNPDEAFQIEDAVAVAPAKGEVLIAVYAASVNPIDSRVRSGYGKAIFAAKAPLPNVLGRDFSGVVLKVGEGVTQYKEGDEVWGVVSPFRAEGMKHGSHSSYITIPTSECQPKPAGMSHVEAASIPYVALTTWMALITQCRRDPTWYNGKKVLVHAGAGGVGTFAVQFLKALGAHVVSTCSTGNVEFVHSLGADEVVDYRTQNYADIVRDCDAVYDLLGKDHTAPSLTTLKSRPLAANDQEKVDAILAACLDKLTALPENAIIPAYKAILKDFDDQTAAFVSDSPVYVSVVGPMMPLTDKLGLREGMKEYIHSTLIKKAEQLKEHGHYFSYSVFEPDEKALEFVTRLANKGKIKPHVGCTFELTRAKEAYSELDSGHARGKVVFEVPVVGRPGL